MNRKSNPWLSLVALVLLAVILVWTCTGCREAEAATAAEPIGNRFTTEWAGWSFYGDAAFYVITDNETNAQYLLVESGAGVGVTALQPGEG